MKKHRVLIVKLLKIVFVFLFLWTQQSLAQTSTKDEDRSSHKGKIDRSLEQLDLKAEQSTKIAEIKSFFHSKMEEHKKKLREARDNMSDLMTTEVTESQAKAQHDKLQQLMSEEGDLHFQIIWKIREVLTPDQRTKFFQKMKLAHDRQKHHRADKDASEH